MKTCPFCAEEIQEAAIKCRHCGEFLSSPPATTSNGWAVIGLGTRVVFVASVLAVLFYGFAYDTTIESGDEGRRIHNIGLMADRQAGLLLFSFLSVLSAGVAYALRRYRLSVRTRIITIAGSIAMVSGFAVWTGLAELMWVWLALYVLS